MTELIVPIRSNRKWTKEEEILLEEYAGVLSTREIAAKLGRPVRGVQSRYQKLNLHPYTAHGYCTAAQVSRITEIPLTTLVDWLKKGQIPGEKVKGGFWRVHWDGVGEIEPSWNGKTLHKEITQQGPRDDCANCGAELSQAADIWCSKRCRGEYTHNLFYRRVNGEDEPGFEKPPYLRPKFQDFLYQAGVVTEAERIDQVEEDELRVMRRLWQRESYFVTRSYITSGQTFSMELPEIMIALGVRLAKSTHLLDGSVDRYRLQRKNDYFRD